MCGKKPIGKNEVGIAFPLPSQILERRNFPYGLDAFLVMIGRHPLEFPKHWECRSRFAIIDRWRCAKLEALIFPVTVFGNSRQNRTSRGTLYDTSRALTCSQISAASSSEPSTFPSNTMWATEYARPRSSVRGDHGGFGDVRMPEQSVLHLHRRNPHSRHFQHVVGAPAIVEVNR